MVVVSGGTTIVNMRRLSLHLLGLRLKVPMRDQRDAESIGRGYSRKIAVIRKLR